MKRIVRLKSLLFLLPLMIFFCDYSTGGICLGNNEGFVNDNVGTGAGNNFALGGNCPSDFPYPDNPINP